MLTRRAALQLILSAPALRVAPVDPRHALRGKTFRAVTREITPGYIVLTFSHEGGADWPLFSNPELGEC